MIKENIKLSKPEVSNNGHDGTINIIIDDQDNIQACIGIEQRESWEEGDKVKKSIRRGVISGKLEDVIAIGWIPGNSVGGKVRCVETTDPPVPDDPEGFLSWSNGKLRRHQGKPIYRMEYYTFSIKEQDILLKDDED